MLTYGLRTNFDEFDDREIDIPLLESTVNGLTPDVWDFMVLCPSEPICGCSFLQVGAPEPYSQFRYKVEIGFCNEKTGPEKYRFYTGDRAAVLRYFVDYLQRPRLPDTSTWEDVTHEMG